MSEPIRVAGLRKEFFHSGRVIPVLQGIDLTIDAGEMIAIVGRSGVGKSTFLHILGTLDNPTAGSVRFGALDVFSLEGPDLAAFRNRRIGFVFQFHHLLPEFTAVENVMMPALIRGTRPREAREAAARLLADVGLTPRATHRPGELSGGEQQRVALARALVLNPDLLLADEPTGNLDARTGAGVHELFFRLNERYGTTMVMVTHNGELARSMPRVLTMEDGLLRDGEAPAAPVAPGEGMPLPDVASVPAPEPAGPAVPEPRE
jgi:lipoprotein-releasing system ATP-binding protein